VIGTLRTLPDHPVVRLGNAWVELFRNIRCWCRFSLVPRGAGAGPAMKACRLCAGGAGLGFFTSARIAEQVRSGIQALPRGQRYAGMAMGFTTCRPTAMCCCPWRFASSFRR
jgi:glutamate/aspartate transport system permease protein